MLNAAARPGDVMDDRGDEAAHRASYEDPGPPEEPRAGGMPPDFPALTDRLLLACIAIMALIALSSLALG